MGGSSRYQAERTGASRGAKRPAETEAVPGRPGPLRYSTPVRSVEAALVVLAVSASCNRGPSESVKQEMARRERIRVFFHDYPKWSGALVADRSEPHLTADVAKELFERAAVETQPDGSEPGLLLCRLDVHPSKPVRDLGSKLDFQLRLEIDEIPRRWCCSRKPQFIVSYANVAVPPGATLDFYVSDKDLRRDDGIGSHDYEHGGRFPFTVNNADFDAECRWLPNRELGEATNLARAGVTVEMKALAEADGVPPLHDARAALQHLAALVGWSDAELRTQVAAYEQAAAAAAR